ncbi:hypothetical protein K1719_015466 [Acacia pycnantha]|nr:hypothetical protein K1719_015466 [Acacia pycnantha]
MLNLARGRNKPRVGRPMSLGGMDYVDSKRKGNFIGEVFLTAAFTALCIIMIKQSPSLNSPSPEEQVLINPYGKAKTMAEACEVSENFLCESLLISRLSRQSQNYAMPTMSLRNDLNQTQRMLLQMTMLSSLRKRRCNFHLLTSCYSHAQNCC